MSISLPLETSLLSIHTLLREGHQRFLAASFGHLFPTEATGLLPHTSLENGEFDESILGGGVTPSVSDTHRSTVS